MRAHPLPGLLAAQLPVTLNTDDPAMFRLTLGQELLTVARAFCLTKADLAEAMGTAVRAAFMSATDAQAILVELDDLCLRP